MVIRAHASAITVLGLAALISLLLSCNGGQSGQGNGTNASPTPAPTPNGMKCVSVTAVKKCEKQANRFALTDLPAHNECRVGEKTDNCAGKTQIIGTVSFYSDP